APDWAMVPTDPCSAVEPAQVRENITCAAVTGARASGAGGTLRAATMLAGTDGVSFFYIVHVDASYGTLQGVEGPQMPATVNDRQPSDATSVMMSIVEGYDRGVVGVGGGYLSDSGEWCLLPTMPAALTANVCSGAFPSGALSGPANIPFTISLVPGSNPRAS